jgi:tetratricopeptide (TPR) repeat protein
VIGRRAMTVALILAAVVSCRPDDQRTDDLDPTGGEQSRDNMSPEAVAQLDSGSVAFRRDDYEAALAHYTRVAELEPDFGAGWFGIYMAQRALGNEEAATAALEQAESIVPGASLLYEEQPDTGR